MRYSLIACLIALCVQLAAQPLQRELHSGWQVSSAKDGISVPATVPGVVHTDLMAAGLIPDPFIGSNVDSVQWVETRSWTYRCSFTVSKEERMARAAMLRFEGLDTYATITLNGHVLGSTDNMFRTWDFEVKGWLKRGINVLEVRFDPIVLGAGPVRARYGRPLPHDSDTSGLAPFARKAAYSFGWDFAPRLATMGIWRPVSLRFEPDAPTLSAALRTISMGEELGLRIEPRWSSIPSERGTIRVSFNGTVVTERMVNDASGWVAPLEIGLADAPRWWPRGSGPQTMHRVRVEAIREHGTPIMFERSVGLRTVELDRSADSIGAHFRFVVNGQPIFMRGCNIVPPDVFLPRGGDSAWVVLVRHMADAHMNMVRVWSGGVYPPEAFFHACDTSGILVWQDLMFGYMVPGGDSAFLANAREEVRQHVDRISAHPSLALFCGNNELDVAWSNWGWQQRYNLHGTDSAAVWNDHHAFFHDSLYRWTAPYPYTPSSPISNWGNAAGLHTGDLHYWGVWHADSSLSSYTRNVGRFMSEYGFQSYPDSTTLARYLDPQDLVLGSAALARRQLSYRTDRPLYDRIQEELGVRPATLAAFITATQEVQALGYGLAVDAHWAAYPRCMGTLLWQLNDCWPGPSWSIMDNLGQRKKAFDAVGSRYHRISEQEALGK